MKLVKKTGLALGSFGLVGTAVMAFAALGMSGCHGGGSDTIATVNGTPITKQDFLDYIMRKKSVLVQSQQGEQPADVAPDQILGVQALSDLVNRQLMLNLAKEMHVMPTADDIDKEIEFEKTRSPNLLTELTKAGVPLEFLKKDVELQLAEYRIVTQGITVTDADVDQFIKSNPTEFEYPPTAKTLVVLVTSVPEKQQVDHDLATGQDFTQVAQRYSKAPNVRTAGVQYAVTDLNKMLPTIREPIERTSEGKTTDWITLGQNTYVKFYVQSKSAATRMNIDPSLREVVRRQIALNRGHKQVDMKQRLLAEFKKSNIDVQLDALKPNWKTYTDAVNAQPAATAATGSGGQSVPTVTK